MKKQTNEEEDDRHMKEEEAWEADEREREKIKNQKRGTQRRYRAKHRKCHTEGWKSGTAPHKGR